MQRALFRNAAFGLLSLACLGLASVQAADKGKGQTIKLKLDPTAGAKANAYFPVPIALSPDKPARVTKEPAYTGKVMYGAIHLGNGPKSEYILAIDMPEKDDYKIYVDKNNNGDLTDDGDGKWSDKRTGQRTMYGLNHYVLRASYGAQGKETVSADYGVAMYEFVGDKPLLLMYREGGATGTIKVGGKEHKLLVVENDADGLFSKPIDDDGKPMKGAPSTRPVWLLIDMNDDGKFDLRDKSEMYDARAPFALDGTVYEPVLTPNGTELKLKTTKRVAFAPKQPTQAEPPKLLASGTVAPDFVANAPDGHSIKLSDYRGKVVVLDFWATWCPPCRASMPHLERIHQAVKDKNVAVLGVCVSDEKAAFDKWLPEHKELTFDFAHDPAGPSDKSISNSLYKVTGIPTTYIIDKDGKVVDAVVGYSGEDDKRIEAALKKAGVEVATQTASRK